MRLVLVAVAIAASLVMGLTVATAQGPQTGIDNFCENAPAFVTEDYPEYCDPAATDGADADVASGPVCTGAVVSEAAREDGRAFGAYVSDRAREEGRAFGAHVAELSTACAEQVEDETEE